MNHVLFSSIAEELPCVLFMRLSEIEAYVHQLVMNVRSKRRRGF